MLNSILWENFVVGVITRKIYTLASLLLIAKKLFRKAWSVLAEGLEKNPDSPDTKNELRELERYWESEKAPAASSF